MPSAFRKNITIVANGSLDSIQPLATLAAALSYSGHRIRFLSNENHESFVTRLSPTIAFVTLHDEMTYDNSDYQSRDFVTMMKNMSTDAELQNLIKHDTRLQVAMAKCDSAEFVSLLKSSRSRRLHLRCSFILEDFSSHVPDLVIVGPQSEFFGIYAKRILGLKSIHLFFNATSEREEERAEESPCLKDWISLDNAIASLGLPRLMVNMRTDIEQDATKGDELHEPIFTQNIIDRELKTIKCSQLDHNFDQESLQERLKSTVSSIDHILKSEELCYCPP